MKALVLLALHSALYLQADAEEARISILELLKPETRLSAFQQYILKSQPEVAKENKWEDPATFSFWHNNLRVSELESEKEPLRYLVTWESEAGAEEEWKDQPLSEEAGLLTARERLHYQTFSADGVPTPEGGAVTNGNVADLNADGDAETIEWNHVAEGQVGIDYVTIRSLGRLTKAGSALVLPIEALSPTATTIIYNTHPVPHTAANAWGAQVADRDKDGLYEVELGPVTGLGPVDVKVSIRWDRNQRRWVGPERKSDDHYVVIDGRSEWDAVAEIKKGGGLRYPLIAPKPEHPDDEPAKASEANKERSSEPYRYRSLRRLSDQQLLAYMGPGRTTWDMEMDLQRSETSVSGFWQLPPRDAALAYVRQNRPPQSRSQYLISTLEDGIATPPEDGQLTLSGGPSIEFPPGGAFAYHLHCSKDGSFLVYVGSLHEWFQVPRTESRSHFEFRCLSISYKDARHLLQTAWWLMKVRTRPLTNASTVKFWSGDSASNGMSTVELVTKGEHFAIRAWHSAEDRGTYLGLGSLSEAYAKSSFINLIGKILKEEVTNRMGEAWTRQAPTRRFIGMMREPATGAERDFLKAKSRELLTLFLQKKVPAGVATEVVGAVGEFGWTEMRELVDAVAAQLDAQQSTHKADEESAAALRSAVKRTLRQLRDFNDPEALFRWVLEDPAVTRFGLSRLLQLDRSLTLKLLTVLETNAKDTLEKTLYAETRDSINSESSVVPPHRTVPTSTEPARKEAITVLLDSETTETERTRLIAELVPSSEPRRYRDPEIDAALLDLISRATQSDDVISASITLAAARRLGNRAWEPLAKYAARTRRIDETLPAMTILAQQDASFLTTLRAMLLNALDEGHGSAPTVLWSIWQLDLRDLAPQVVEAATRSPENYEGEHGRTSSTQRLLIKQRFHRARHVAALWNEEDPLTRAKLLIAFSAANAPEFEIGRESATERLQADLAKIWPTLSAAQQKELRDFTSWCEEHVLTKLPGTIEASQLALVIQTARSALK